MEGVGDSRVRRPTDARVTVGPYNILGANITILRYILFLLRRNRINNMNDNILLLLFIRLYGPRHKSARVAK